MSSIYKRIANANHEEIGGLTTRSVGKHGIGRGFSKSKRAVNRRAKRVEARLHFREQMA